MKPDPDDATRPRNIARRRIVGYVTLSVTLGLAFVALRDVAWTGSSGAHTVMEVIATVMALVVGIMALVRFYTRKDAMFLFIGAGFIGTGILDGYHAVVTSDIFARLYSSVPESLSPWSWIASRFLLSVLLWLSWLMWYRADRSGKQFDYRPIYVYGAVATLTAASFLLFAFFPLPRAYYLEFFFSRPEDLIPALFFLLALIGYLQKGAWREDAFEHWIVLALIVSLLGQGLYMASSARLFDGMFDIAHLLKKASYLCVLTGLMISMYELFNRVDTGARKLSAANMRLAEEIENRKRAEKVQGRFFSLSLDLLCIAGFDGYFKRLNPAWSKVLGFSMDELKARPFVDFVHPEDREATIIEAEKLLRGRETSSFENRYECKDGSYRWFVWTASADMEQKLYYAVARDITARKQIVQDLHDSEGRLRGVLDNVIDGIITIDVKGSIESFNPAAERIFGYKEQEVLGHNVKMLMPEPYTSAHDGYLRNFLNTGEAKIIGKGREVEGLRKDGTVFPLYLGVSKLPMEDGVRFTGIVRDITDLTKARKQLLETTVLQDAILNNANFSIISTRTDGVITMFNRAAQSWLGYRAEEVIGKLTPAVIHDSDEVVARARALSEELGRTIEPGFETFVAKAREGGVDENEWTYIRRDGSRFPVLLSVTALWDAKREISGFLGIASDITERRKIDRMKNEFISTVSHELRTPLTSIRGSLGLIAGGAAGELPDKVRKLVDIASNNSDRLVRLINDILDIEKIESGKMVFNLKSSNLTQLIGQIIEANRPYAAGLGGDIVFNRAGPDVVANIDEDRFSQVLTNLLSNAAKFSPKDSQVEVSVTHEADRVRVAVHDHGPGIAEEFRSRIFEKFSQADATDERKRGGSGLGLSISKAIVEKMGGSLSFDTEVGVGTSFYVDLPMPPTANVPEVPDLRVAGNGARILICEDDPDIAQLLRILLEQGGYVTDLAHSAEEAKAKLSDSSFAAMTLDLRLPGQDGIALIRELRADDRTQYLPIVVISAVAQAGREILDGGAVDIVDWLDKPIDTGRLLRAVKMAARRGAAGLPRVLHVEDDADAVQILDSMLNSVATVVPANSLAAARALLKSEVFELVILDIQLPDGSGLDLLSEIRAIMPPLPVLIFSADEVSPSAAETVSAALVKSRTSNADLVSTIKALVEPQERGNAKNDP